MGPIRRDMRLVEGCWLNVIDVLVGPNAAVFSRNKISAGRLAISTSDTVVISCCCCCCCVVELYYSHNFLPLPRWKSLRWKTMTITGSSVMGNFDRLVSTALGSVSVTLRQNTACSANLVEAHFLYHVWGEINRWIDIDSLLQLPFNWKQGLY